MNVSVVYLIHFNTPYQHARHYMGCTDRLSERLSEHRKGNGARLMEVVNDAGIKWQLARTWLGGFELERKLKARKEGPRFCPICLRTGYIEHRKRGVLSSG
jgi:predicted GIY-YIG superfamily endonuclease